MWTSSFYASETDGKPHLALVAVLSLHRSQFTNSFIEDRLSMEPDKKVWNAIWNDFQSEVCSYEVMGQRTAEARSGVKSGICAVRWKRAIGITRIISATFIIVLLELLIRCTGVTR